MVVLDKEGLRMGWAPSACLCAQSISIFWVEKEVFENVQCSVPVVGDEFVNGIIWDDESCGET
jgi:hypothetical protein